MIHLDQRGGAGFFSDYATQLMDTASYALSIEGPASHDVYKRRQVEAARLRVLGRARATRGLRRAQGTRKVLKALAKV
jgi:hypothetical protein